VFFNLVDNSGIFKDGAVVREIDGGGLFGQDLHAATGVFVAFFEGLQGVGGLATETEGLCYFGPVELEGCTALEGARRVSWE